jgi:hypothetical protein
MMERGPTSVRFAGREDPARPKQGGWACRSTVLGLQLGGREHSVDGSDRKLSFGGLEICRQPCEPFRASMVGGQEVPWCGRWCWVIRAIALERPGTSAGIAGGSAVLWFCGGST